MAREWCLLVLPPGYRRRLDAMIDVLIEKQVITREELDFAISEKRAVWSKAAEQETS